MKKIYYLAHCGSGRSVHYQLIELFKEDGNKLLFHINDFDYDKDGFPKRTITLKAKRVKRKNIDGEDYEMIDFHSSKAQYKYHFITEREIDDNVEPEKRFIEND